MTKKKLDVPGGKLPEQEALTKEAPVAGEEGGVPVPEVEPAFRPVSVVIPYCREYAQGNELLFALRSWFKHARFPFQVVVIGDGEEWMDAANLVLIDCPRVSGVPSVDTLHKLWVAVNSPEVTGVFIWSNDDIYLVNPVGMEHIALPKVRGNLEPGKYNGHYAAAMRRTVALLQEAGMPNLDYGTHTPVLLDKHRLAGMLPEDDTKASVGVLYTSLYFNRYNEAHPVRLNWKTDPFLLTVVSKSPDDKLVDTLLKDKVFMNNARSGYSPWLERRLSSMFPDKCPAET